MSAFLLGKPVKGNPPIWQTYDGHLETARENGWCPAPGPCLSKVYYYPGTDYAVPMQTPVYSAEGGFCQVKDQGPKGYGMVIYIDHGYKRITIYAHLSVVLIYEGQYVGKGELIGLSGSSGFSTGPHLHFEFRVDGYPTDPDRYQDPQPVPGKPPVVHGGIKTWVKQRMFTRAPARRKRKPKG
jgi:murein DD-endopeptidase MepM/ murein hydrolase activator NlpD